MLCPFQRELANADHIVSWLCPVSLPYPIIRCTGPLHRPLSGGRLRLTESQRLSAEAFSSCFVGKHIGRKRLDGYNTFELLIGRAEHQPHPADSDLLKYAVMAQNLPDNWSLWRH